MTFEPAPLFIPYKIILMINLSASASYQQKKIS